MIEPERPSDAVITNASARAAGCPASVVRLSLGQELRDFLHCVRHPSLAPRLPGQRLGPSWWTDWFPSVSLGRLLQWALLLWVVNLFVFGPLAVAAAGAGGASHRLNMQAIPWVHALIWAPIVEELVFRYGLRRPLKALLLLPFALLALFQGPGTLGVVGLGLFVLATTLPYVLSWRRTTQPLTWSARRRIIHFFPWLFHLAALAFAALHLYNFNLGQTPWWFLPLLVLPQWATGLVLGWLRIRRGLGAAITLHALFNAGPLTVVWLIVQFMPELA